jgi:1-phosphofructokinase
VLTAALEGGVALLKLSHEDAIADGHSQGAEIDELVRVAQSLAARGASRVVITRADRPTVAYFGDQTFLVETPPLEEVDSRGAGDAMTAALAVAMRRGLSDVDMLKLACAAGAATVARHGLGSAERGLIDALTGQVTVSVLTETAMAQSEPQR